MEHIVAESETIGGSIEDVRAFCTVYELGSISAAARQLDTTKGGLSRRISRLEDRLGVKLLARTPRAVSSTEEGTAFYDKARDALALLSEAADGARKSQSIPRGHLRVTAPPDFGVDVLPQLLLDFRAEHPQVTVELLISNALLDLAAMRIDLALRATSADLPDTNYRASTLIDFTIALYAAPGYLATRETPVTPADLAAHDVVGKTESAGTTRLDLTHRLGRSESLTLRPVISTSDFASAYRLIQAGGGIGALPEVVVNSSAADRQLTRVLPDWFVARAKLHAISIAGRDAPARVRVFREFLRNRFAML